MPRMISMPVIGLPLRSSLHLSQVGLGLLGLSSSTMRPLNVPFAFWLISTIDLGWPVSSSMVFQRPTAGSAAWAIGSASTSAAVEQTISNLDMFSPRRGRGPRPGAGRNPKATGSAGVWLVSIVTFDAKSQFVARWRRRFRCVGVWRGFRDPRWDGKRVFHLAHGNPADSRLHPDCVVPGAILLGIPVPFIKELRSIDPVVSGGTWDIDLQVADRADPRPGEFVAPSTYRGLQSGLCSRITISCIDRSAFFHGPLALSFVQRRPILFP